MEKPFSFPWPVGRLELVGPGAPNRWTLTRWQLLWCLVSTEFDEAHCYRWKCKRQSAGTMGGCCEQQTRMKHDYSYDEPAWVTNNLIYRRSPNTDWPFAWATISTFVMTTSGQRVLAYPTLRKIGPGVHRSDKPDDNWRRNRGARVKKAVKKTQFLCRPFPFSFCITVSQMWVSGRYQVW